MRETSRLYPAYKRYAVQRACALRDTNSDADKYVFEITSETTGFYATTTSYKVLNNDYTIMPTWEYGVFNVTATNIKENPAAFLGWKTVVLIMKKVLRISKMFHNPS